MACDRRPAIGHKTKSLLYSLGAFSTICQISRNDAEARLNAILSTGSDPGSRAGVGALGRPSPSGGSRAPTVRDAIDEDVLDTEQAGVDVARYAADRIMARTIETFAGHRLAELVAAVLETEGFRCQVMPEGPQTKASTSVAGKGLLGLESPNLWCKSNLKRDLLTTQIRAAAAGRKNDAPAEHGLLVAWGGVTKQAKDLLSTQRFAIRIWDSETLLDEG